MCPSSSSFTLVESPSFTTKRSQVPMPPRLSCEYRYPSPALCAPRPVVACSEPQRWFGALEPLLQRWHTESEMPTDGSRLSRPLRSGLHRHEVLLRPQYQRLIIGKVEGEEQKIKVCVSRRARSASRTALISLLFPAFPATAPRRTLKSAVRRAHLVVRELLFALLQRLAPPLAA